MIDHSAKMNLLAYAEGNYLDHIGALLGVYRLEAASAACILVFTLSEVLSYDAVIPAGTRVSTGDGVTFATVKEFTIPAGTLADGIDASCIQAGESGNGYVPGQVSKLVDVLAFGVSVQNVTATAGGTEIESDEAFRERIQIAPESFSVAGPKEAYKYFAVSADPDIIDVAVVGPPDADPGHVKIYPLMTGGAFPSNEDLAKVYEACNADNVRPDTDYVEVLSPVQVLFKLKMTYWIDESHSTESNLLREAIESAAGSWVSWQRSALGRDINPSELVKRVVNAGAKRCVVDSPSFTAIKDWELAVCNDLELTYGGLERW